jgi:hypothetical protein
MRLLTCTLSGLTETYECQRTLEERIAIANKRRLCFGLFLTGIVYCLVTTPFLTTEAMKPIPVETLM